MQRFARQRIKGGGGAVAGHRIYLGLVHVHLLVQGAAQVAVSEDPHDVPVAVCYRRHAEALAGHLHERLAQGSTEGYGQDAVTLYA